MPIYAYRCETCGFSKDVLQKVSDAPLTDCLSCGKSSFKKQLTAAGFQLKGSGWYVTDFRNGSGGTSAPAATNSTTETTSADKGAASESSSASSAAPASTTPSAT
jgi:putative FmdB family regulatory protein